MAHINCYPTRNNHRYKYCLHKFTSNLFVHSQPSCCDPVPVPVKVGHTTHPKNGLLF